MVVERKMKKMIIKIEKSRFTKILNEYPLVSENFYDAYAKKEKKATDSIRRKRIRLGPDNFFSAEILFIIGESKTVQISSTDKSVLKNLFIIDLMEDAKYVLLK